MKTLKEALVWAKENKLALAHFNFSDSTQFNVLTEVARDLNAPIIAGVSEGEKNFIGISNAVALVSSARANGVEVYLNLDHAHSVEDCRQAIDMGFDSVMFDGSKLSFEENINKTKEVVTYAREKGDALVEGELGYIGSSSKMLNEIPQDAGLEKTSKEQALEFVSKTGVDILAPSVGNIHGMLKDSSNPKLDIERIENISSVLDYAFLVLHGGSGITDEDFTASIMAGINIVHINTEIRRAYRQGIESGLKEQADQIAPYKYIKYGAEQMKEVVKKRVILFGNGKI